MRKVSFAVAMGLLGMFSVHGAAQQPNASGHLAVAPAEVEWRAGPESLPPGARMAVLQGDPQGTEMFTWRIRLPAKYLVPPHHHPRTEHVTVLSGRLYLGHGETLVGAQAKELPAGSLFVVQPGTPHFVFTEEETVLQLHTAAPWGITYVNPADDPRNR
jgi:quercetin dioxygenase-like cupin family protein